MSDQGNLTTRELWVMFTLHTREKLALGISVTALYAFVVTCGLLLIHQSKPDFGGTSVLLAAIFILLPPFAASIRLLKWSTQVDKQMSQIE